MPFKLIILYVDYFQSYDFIIWGDVNFIKIIKTIEKFWDGFFK